MYMNLQADYIFGSNPKKISYMAGFGSNHPIPPRIMEAPPLHQINKDPK
jgi:hypothetical protein